MVKTNKLLVVAFSHVIIDHGKRSHDSLKLHGLTPRTLVARKSAYCWITLTLETGMSVYNPLLVVGLWRLETKGPCFFREIIFPLGYQSIWCKHVGLCKEGGDLKNVRRTWWLHLNAYYWAFTYMCLSIIITKNRSLNFYDVAFALFLCIPMLLLSWSSALDRF